MDRSTKYLVAALLLASAPLWAQSKMQSETGVVQVFVEDEAGHALSGAPVFISNGSHIQYATSDSKGVVSLTMPSGNYTISSALAVPRRDGLERFASRQARVQVVPQDMTSVMLTLHPVTEQIDDLSLSTLKKIGVAEEVAKYTN